MYYFHFEFFASFTLCTTRYLLGFKCYEGKTQHKKLLVTRLAGLSELRPKSFYSFRKQVLYSAYPSFT